MPNNYLSMLYKHIIQVENENMGLKVCVCGGGGGGGHKHTIAPNQKSGGGGAMRLCPPSRFLRQCVCMCLYIYLYSSHFKDLIKHIDIAKNINALWWTNAIKRLKEYTDSKIKNVLYIPSYMEIAIHFYYIGLISKTTLKLTIITSPAITRGSQQ